MIVISSVFVLSCGDDGGNSNGTTVSVTIDGTDYSFVCNRVASGYEYQVGCIYNQSKRLDVYKASDMNGAEVKVGLTDVPDSSLFDSPYGIEYACSTAAIPAACLTTAVPVYDAATTTISANNVEMPEINNRTAEFGNYVAGQGSHSISFSMNAAAIEFYQ